VAFSPAPDGRQARATNRGNDRIDRPSARVQQARTQQRPPRRKLPAPVIQTSRRGIHAAGSPAQAVGPTPRRPTAPQSPPNEQESPISGVSRAGELLGHLVLLAPMRQLGRIALGVVAVLSEQVGERIGGGGIAHTHRP